MTDRPKSVPVFNSVLRPRAFTLRPTSSGKSIIGRRSILGTIAMSPEQGAEHYIREGDILSFEVVCDGLVARHIGVAANAMEEGWWYFRLTEATCGKLSETDKQGHHWSVI